jgi:hypothetical protein
VEAIGTDDACEITSTEIWTDLAAVPDGFDRSIDDLHAELVGTFDEAGTDGMRLEVAAGPGDITLVRGSASSGPCSDSWTLPLDLTLTHPDFVWTGAAEVIAEATGATTVRPQLTADDAALFPLPSFDVDQDFTWFTLDLEPIASGWEVAGVWHLESADYTAETVLEGTLTP